MFITSTNFDLFDLWEYTVQSGAVMVEAVGCATRHLVMVSRSRSHETWRVEIVMVRSFQ